MRAAAVLWRVHQWTYRASGGRLGGRLLGIPVLLLTTVGRRTGRLHTTALLYFPDGKTFVVIASSGGAPVHPAWWFNLRARREAQIQIGQRRLHVRAREAEGPERQRLWARAVQAYRGYAVYQARTSRRIPVVILMPANDS